MPKPIKKITAEHGTKYAYNQGCRCDACTKANSARSWAERRIGRWDGGVVEGLLKGVCHVGDDIVITADDLYDAIRRHEHLIKLGALAAYRTRMQKS